jgi:hypothetical protein
LGFPGITDPGGVRRVTRAHVIAWRKEIGKKAPATVRRKIAAVSGLFDYLCDRNAVASNPVAGVKRPKEGATVCARRHSAPESRPISPRCDQAICHRAQRHIPSWTVPGPTIHNRTKARRIALEN